MAVPNTNTFSLQNVVDEINPTTDDLQDCVNDANSAFYDTDYYTAPATSLLEFRNYNDNNIYLSGLLTDNGLNSYIRINNIDNSSPGSFSFTVRYKISINQFSTNNITINNIVNNIVQDPDDILTLSSAEETVDVTHTVNLDGFGGKAQPIILNNVSSPIEWLENIRLEATIISADQAFSNSTNYLWLKNRDVKAFSISSTGNSNPANATSPYTTRYFGYLPSLLVGQVGNNVWTDSSATTLFNGNNLYYRDENFNYSYKINSSGEITEVVTI